MNVIATYLAVCGGRRAGGAGRLRRPAAGRAGRGRRPRGGRPQPAAGRRRVGRSRRAERAAPPEVAGHGGPQRRLMGSTGAALACRPRRLPAEAVCAGRASPARQRPTPCRSFLARQAAGACRGKPVMPCYGVLKSRAPFGPAWASTKAP
jgi:hypothetical protein